MSFFKSKTIIVRVREVALTFNMLSKKEIDSLKFYGKITEKDVEEDKTLIQAANEEMMELLASKIVKQDDQKVPTAEDLMDLTNGELIDMIEKVSGSSESIKQSLNRK